MKPMLASPAPAKLKFPVFASPKIDGIRAVNNDMLTLSRSLKPIPNRFVQDTLARRELIGLDGELAVGPPNATDLMQRTTSGVMSREGEPGFTWWVFDYWTQPTVPYVNRFTNLSAGMSSLEFPHDNPRVKLLPQALIETSEQLLLYEEDIVNQGFEGIMIRSLEGIYKYGRSTANEGHLLKLKRWVDAEAVVIGFEEAMFNGNEATVNELGKTSRSSNQANLVPKNTLGSFIVMKADGELTEMSFRVSPGVLTHQQRKEVWDNKSEYLGKILTYKTFVQSGVKDKPRFNIFKAFRDQRDMSK